jgi:LacI family transcriptional regulator
LNKRVTIYTIAEKLGVSSTTVYRALNNKPMVHADTRKAILKMAERLSFKPNTIARGLARKVIRIAVLLYTNFPEFHSRIIDGVKETAQELKDYNVTVDYFVYNKGDTESEEGRRSLSGAVSKIAKGKYSGLLATGIDVNEYEILKKNGIPLAFIVTDNNVERRFCIRYNGFVAGMMAGELFYWRLGAKAKVAVASGFEHVEIHSEILRGFKEQMTITPLNLAAVMYNEDKEKLAYTNTNKLLKEHPDIKGIYVNSYNSKGVIRAITAQGLAGKICLITSDINSEIRRCLEQGIVMATIFQNQYRQGRLGLRYLYQSISENEPVDDTVLINPEIIFRSNLSLYG